MSSLGLAIATFVALLCFTNFLEVVAHKKHHHKDHHKKKRDQASAEFRGVWIATVANIGKLPQNKIDILYKKWLHMRNFEALIIYVALLFLCCIFHYICLYMFVYLYLTL